MISRTEAQSELLIDQLSKILRNVATSICERNAIMVRLNIFDGEYCVDFIAIVILFGYVVYWIVSLGKSFNTLSTREVLANSGSPLQWFVAFIEIS